MKIPDVVPSFANKIIKPLKAAGITNLQVNFGYRCNLKCTHCHVGAGPDRSEAISAEVLKRCLQVIEKDFVPSIDITGGSPEIHPLLPWFISECAERKCQIRVRSNGVILLDEKFRHLMEIYAANKIELILSLPHMDSGTTNAQRGRGVFEGAIESISQLNAHGYGEEGTGLILNLVHNPVGAYLPSKQSSLESSFRHRLSTRWGIRFNNLLCITNMPVGRYLEYLFATDNYSEYMETLIKAFNPGALGKVMCKYTLSVGWDGSLYDCDFNQVLNMRVNHGAPDTIFDFDKELLGSRQITVADHCYGCTAGSGSSCGGAIEK